jgi:hypothetical protein
MLQYINLLLMLDISNDNPIFVQLVFYHSLYKSFKL